MGEEGSKPTPAEHGEPESAMVDSVGWPVAKAKSATGEAARSTAWTGRARLPRRARPSQGFGLGLTLARRVAEVPGGRIAVEPVAVRDGREEGCRVTLILPVSAPAVAAPAR
jgi:hypothetical protein